jgi:glyoxylase-like metal-dependent hydrolase (beta-lactamase superfamily II)
MKLTFSALVALALAPLAAAQQDFSKVQIQTVDVAPGVHMLVGSGGNIGISSGSDGVLIIDDQYAPLTEKIRAAVSAISSGPIRFVVNTHWHGRPYGRQREHGGRGRRHRRP